MISTIMMTRFLVQDHTQVLDMTLRGLDEYAQIWTPWKGDLSRAFGDDRQNFIK